ncbi:tetratricopeptide repeat protein [Flavobacterium yafengii]|uniref:Tetratricopeptide repeat protein n=1 Tax=Flavobacterium yafengii TaxID=3041253 RepID=A0AAW6TT13_9FLAO|nr:tetratricopeptide repeat protein [Flavobacterium yafengii]MDI5950347.1 tetratricopeptide repeat protein [Flavobacterium yafengii]
MIDTQLSLLGKSNKILSNEMSLSRLDNKLGGFTMNFEGVKYFTHSAGNEGFRCNYIGSFENGNGIVIMANDGSGRIIEDITRSIASMNNWKNFPFELRKESISLAIRKESLKDIKQGIEYYKKLKKNNYNEYNFSDESELNSLGHDFLGNDKIESAFEIFNLNVNEFPNSGNVYDSRGESYFYKKDYLLSKKDYLKALELDPTNQNAKEMLLKIEKLM